MDGTCGSTIDIITMSDKAYKEAKNLEMKSDDEDLKLGGFVLVEEATTSSTPQVQGIEATLPQFEEALSEEGSEEAVALGQEVCTPDSAKPEAPVPVEDPEFYECPRSCGRKERTWIVSQRDQYCPVRGCPVVTRSVKKHVLSEHLSFMFASIQEPHLMRDPGFYRYRDHMVMVLAQWLIGQTAATYDDLVEFLRRHAGVSAVYIYIYKYINACSGTINTVPNKD
ncbi:unnamed protein product [Mytilus coruscus]|uniref:Uncharacterized protein n=1 Tax=Mytilus coruscus TaxID=42192 RepID=A0A6J8DFX1_MYTCO|nr:unnamed protein product [Mytilus coruscus]